MPQTHGIHHVTAVTAKASENAAFYTQVLGLRLVKKTVNQDDVSAYHLFYADAVGTPGTDLTFFDWEQAGARVQGGDTISRTYFRVEGTDALHFWESRLSDLKVAVGGVTEVDGRGALLFEDKEGQRLGIIDDLGQPFHGKAWSTDEVPLEFALRGFYAVELTVPDLENTDMVLADLLNWEKVGEYMHPVNQQKVWKYGMDGGGPGKEVHVREEQIAPMHHSFAGTVHHVAFRVEDENEMLAWVYHLDQLGMPNSGIVERYYFKSLYFRISQGILFEIATDGPGFAVDEDVEHLGEALSLPPFLEPSRASIEAGLKQI